MKLKTAIEIEKGRVVAKDLVKNDNGQSTLLAFDEGAVIARHKAPGDVMVYVVEGDVVFIVEGNEHKLSQGDYLTLSVDTEHEVCATSKAKVLLTIIRTQCNDCCCEEQKEPEVEGLLSE